MIRISVILCCFWFSLPSNAQLTLSAETGFAFNTMNDIRFPNEAESSSNLVDIPAEFGTGSTLFYRLRTSYTFNDKHTVSLLYAPLNFITEGVLDTPIRFGEETFSTNVIMRVSYTFNSYRGTYRYRIVDTEKLQFGLGLTGKIRDAEITFYSEGRTDKTTDLGFVPLINFRLELYPTDNLTFCFNGDALVGSQGRAEDVFAGFEYAISTPLSLLAGYRILEGGADVDQVYSFSLIHYASIGAVWQY